MKQILYTQRFAALFPSADLDVDWSILAPVQLTSEVVEAMVMMQVWLSAAGVLQRESWVVNHRLRCSVSNSRISASSF